MKPLTDRKYKLERYDGKGGWTYALLPEILKDRSAPFNWRKVKGFIDDYEIKRYHLMPMADKGLFLPVRAEIRKQIKKEAGDWVHIILYPDSDPLEIPGELIMCLEDEPRALTFFNKLTDNEKKYYIQWIYAAKRTETRTNRLAETINRLSLGLKKYDVV